MTDLALVTSGKLRVVKSYEEALTMPTAETLALADVVRQDTTNGKATGANATSDAEARAWGIVTEVGPGIVTVHRRCLLDGFDLAALDYDAPVYLSGTDKKLSDADAGVNEAQTITITGTPTGGDFTLTFDGQTTSAIAYNATASTVLTALRALSNIENDDVSATGGALPGTPVVVTFAGKYAKNNVPAMTANGAGLTGGTSPTVTITTSTAGIESVKVGRVVGGFATLLGTAADKLLYLEFPL